MKLNQKISRLKAPVYGGASHGKVFSLSESGRSKGKGEIPRNEKLFGSLTKEGEK